MTKTAITENNSCPTRTPAGRLARCMVRSSRRPAASCSRPTITIRPETMPILSFRFVTAGGSHTASVAIRQAVLAGWTGRDLAAVELGAFAEVEPHWDQLILRSWAITDGNRQLYQEAAVSSMLPPATLIRKFTGSDALPEGFAMFSGTLPAIGGLRPAQRFEFEF